MRVEVWTDGSAGHDRSGGWAACLRFGSLYREIHGAELDVTNQYMELYAAMRGLALLKGEGRAVTVYSDSAYLINCFNQGWIETWRRRNWRNRRNQPVANRELWETIEALAAVHDVKWVHVKGHNGTRLNERCDELAGAARRKLLQANATLARQSEARADTAEVVSNRLMTVRRR